MIAALSGLALAAFLAATPLPMQSEAVFVALQIAGAAPLWAMVVVATLANTAGSAVTWATGRGIRGLQGRLGGRLRISPAQLARAEAFYTRFGRWSLLLSWAPLGDLLCFLAGTMRMPLWQFLAIVGFAKGIRYIVVAMLTAGAISLTAA